MRGRTTLAVAALLVLAACGAEEEPAAPVGDEPATPGALAAIAASHLPDGMEPVTARVATEEDEALGVSMRLGPDEDLLAVGVGVGMPPPECGTALEDFDGCEVHEGGYLMWDNEEPEEDPGVYAFVVQKGDAWASAYYSGSIIEDDPRTSELSVPVATAVALVKDEAFDLTTTQEWVDRGAELDWLEPAE